MTGLNIRRYIKGAGAASVAAVGLFLFAGTSNAQYGGYGYPQPNYGGYGNYGGYNSGYDRRIQRAYDKGVQDGRKQADRDIRNGGYGSGGGWRNSNRGGIFGGIFNNGTYGRNAQEEQAYNDGFRRGYQEDMSYNRGYRNGGSYNNGYYDDDQWDQNGRRRGHGRGNGHGKHHGHDDRDHDDDDDDDD